MYNRKFIILSLKNNLQVQYLQLIIILKRFFLISNPVYRVTCNIQVESFLDSAMSQVFFCQGAFENFGFSKNGFNLNCLSIFIPFQTPRNNNFQVLPDRNILDPWPSPDMVRPVCLLSLYIQLF